MARATSKEPCGCESDDTSWVKLCAAHETERSLRIGEAALDSLQWLINHYERFPQEENLRHAVFRLAQVGKAAYGRPSIVLWVRTNADSVKRIARGVTESAAR